MSASWPPVQDELDRVPQPVHGDVQLGPEAAARASQRLVDALLFDGAGDVLVRPDHGAVEDQPLQVGILKLLEDPEPVALPTPPIEPSPHRVPVPEAFGKVAPKGPGLGDPEDRVDEKTVVLGGHACVSGPAVEENPDPLPVFICYRMAMHG